MGGFDQRSTIANKLWGRTALDPARAAIIKKAYLLLALAVASGIGGAFAGVNTPFIVQLFSGWQGLILMLVVLNVMPRIVLAVRHNPVLGVSALIGNGFAAGLILAPALHVVTRISAGIVEAALILSAMVFAAVTLYVMTTEKVYTARHSLMMGIVCAVLGAIVLNFFLNIGWLGILIAAAIGVFGVLLLVHATSGVLHDPTADNAITFAVMLFGGLFSLFVAALSFSHWFGLGGRR